MRIARKPATDFIALLGLRQATPVSFLAECPPFLLSSSGRGALECACRALPLGFKAVALVPEYLCDVVLHPLLQLGIRFRWYAIRDDMSPDWADLESKLPQATLALLIHYFGQPQDAKFFASLCSRHGVFFIEDNAHGFGASLNGRLLGQFGDFGFSSPWKQYPVPMGAILFGKTRENVDKAKKTLQQWEMANLQIFKPLCKENLRKIITFFPQLRKRLLPFSVEMDALSSIQSAHKVPPQIMSIIQHLDYVADASTRRSCYNIWQRYLQNTALRPVFTELHCEAAPLCFPALAPSQKIRDIWLKWGWEHDIAVHTWPTLPAPLRNLEKAQQFWQKLLCFPIHQNLDLQKMKNYLATLSLPADA